jgi:hypothetical protein
MKGCLNNLIFVRRRVELGDVVLAIHRVPNPHGIVGDLAGFRVVVIVEGDGGPEFIGRQEREDRRQRPRVSLRS